MQSEQNDVDMFGQEAADLLRSLGEDSVVEAGLQHKAPALVSRNKIASALEQVRLRREGATSWADSRRLDALIPDAGNLRWPMPNTVSAHGTTSQDGEEILNKIILESGQSDLFYTIRSSEFPDRPRTNVLNVATLNRMLLHKAQEAIAKDVREILDGIGGYMFIHEHISKYCVLYPRSSPMPQ